MRLTNTYVAVEGGFDVPQVLGSVSTYVRGGLGGWLGRALRAGDVVPLARNRVGEREEIRMEAADSGPPARFRVLDGPQSDHFSEAERDKFFARNSSSAQPLAITIGIVGKIVRTSATSWSPLISGSPISMIAAAKSPSIRRSFPMASAAVFAVSIAKPRFSS